MPLLERLNAGSVPVVLTMRVDWAWLIMCTEPLSGTVSVSLPSWAMVGLTTVSCLTTMTVLATKVLLLMLWVVPWTVWALFGSRALLVDVCKGTCLSRPATTRPFSTPWVLS